MGFGQEVAHHACLDLAFRLEVDHDLEACLLDLVVGLAFHLVEDLNREVSGPVEVPYLVLVLSFLLEVVPVHLVEEDLLVSFLLEP